MRTLLGFLRLPRAERRLLLRCWRLLVRTTLSLRAQPIPRLMRDIDARIAPRRRFEALAPQNVARLLGAAAHRVWPHPTCLVTALSGYELLREQGWPVAVVIGVHSTAGDFKAHAWLEHEGRVILGAPVTPYEPVWRWPT